jgi:hypothetical protein
VLAAYGDTIQSATFTYRSGAGAALNPGRQGIGFYNVFFDPVAIGTSKQVTNVVDNGNGHLHHHLSGRCGKYGWGGAPQCSVN